MNAPKAFYKKLKYRRKMPHFKGFGMINMQYEIRIWSKFLINPQMTKTSQDNNNLNYVHFMNHFYEYHKVHIF